MLVNGVMTQGQVLVNGDVLQLGQTQFRFEAAQAPAASAADPTRAFQPGTLPVQQPENMGIAPFTGQPQYIPPVQPTATSSGTPPFLWVALGLLLACPLMCVAFMSFAILPYVVTLVGLIVLAWGLIDKNNLALQGRFPTSFVQTKIFGGAFLLLFGGMWSIWWIQNHIDDSRYKRVDNEPTYSRPEGSGPGYDRPYKLSEDIQSPPRGN